MKLYIFLMTEEVLDGYYYRGDILRRFFREWRRRPEDPLLDKQMTYITEKIPAGIFALSDPGRENRCRAKVLTSETGEWYDTMKVQKQFWCVDCSSLSEAERTVFPVLKAMAKPFFIISEEGMHYGWVLSRKRQPSILT